MHYITVLDRHGETVSEQQFTNMRDAGLAYCRAVLNQPDDHLRWSDDDVLPGMTPEVHAERFGNPCDEPCCAPLAQPWPETDQQQHRERNET